MSLLRFKKATFVCDLSEVILVQLTSVADSNLLEKRILLYSCTAYLYT